MAVELKKTRVKDLIRLMESWAPAWYAESWDKVGLLVGDPGARVHRAWTALELCPGLIQEALAQKATCLLLHHPPHI
jgi:putative NIF3 family GTP cyclohydrolase 1 type 2